MTKAEMNALEKVFAAETNDRLPFQSKAKIYQSLCSGGYLETMNRKFDHDRFGVVVAGYQLTHLGRITYCASCADHES